MKKKKKKKEKKQLCGLESRREWKEKVKEGREEN